MCLPNTMGMDLIGNYNFFFNISESQNLLLYKPLGVKNEFNILPQDSCLE